MRIAMCAAVAALGLSIGCGGSGTPTPTASNGAPATTGSATAAAAIPNDPIGKVVFEFLDSVRVGQGENAAAKLLTPLALKQIQEQDLNIAPPGSPTARFEVKHVEMMPEGDRAVVQSIWTDVDADGKEYQEPIYCALRICDGQWRIHGMAQEMGEGQQPVVIDFESLNELIDQQPGPQGVPADRLATPTGEQPAAAVATDPFNQPAQR